VDIDVVAAIARRVVFGHRVRHDAFVHRSVTSVTTKDSETGDNFVVPRINRKHRNSERFPESNMKL